MCIRSLRMMTFLLRVVSIIFGFVLFRRQDFWYEHMTSESAFCSFVYAISTELRA